MTEAALQAKIRSQLMKSGWLVNKLIQTSLNGTPDLIAHKEGRTIYIEVKRKGGKLRPLQEYRAKQLKEHEIESYLIDDIEELKKYGLT